MRFFKFFVMGMVALALIGSVTAGDKEVQYAKSTQIILNTTETGANVAENMTNLPVYIKLDKDNFDFGKLTEGIAGDITIAAGEGNFLPYKVVSFNKSAKEATLLVIVGKVDGDNSTQALTLSYGKNIDAVSDADAKAEIEEKKTKEIEDQGKTPFLFGAA